MSNQPILSIDLKKNRIRIHKRTLHLLGNPEYIQLLVNPEARLIAVRCSVKSDYLAHRIRMYQLASKNSYELYSAHLIRSLQTVNSGWKENEAYRLYGIINPKEGLAQFPMDNGIPLTDIMEEYE